MASTRMSKKEPPEAGAPLRSVSAGLFRSCQQVHDRRSPFPECVPQKRSPAIRRQGPRGAESGSEIRLNARCSATSATRLNSLRPNYLRWSPGSRRGPSGTPGLDSRVDRSWTGRAMGCPDPRTHRGRGARAGRSSGRSGLGTSPIGQPCCGSVGRSRRARRRLEWPCRGGWRRIISEVVGNGRWEVFSTHRSSRGDPWMQR